ALRGQARHGSSLPETVTELCSPARVMADRPPRVLAARWVKRRPTKVLEIIGHQFGSPDAKRWPAENAKLLRGDQATNADLDFAGFSAKTLRHTTPRGHVIPNVRFVAAPSDGLASWRRQHDPMTKRHR